MKKIIIRILYALVPFAFLVFGLYLIWDYLLGIPITYSTDSLGGEGAAVDFVGLFLSLIWIVIWYVIILTIDNKTKEEENSQIARTAMTLPPITLLLFFLWWFALYPLYFNIEKKIVSHRSKLLYGYITTGQHEEALDLIKSYSQDDFRYTDNNLTLTAAKHDEKVFEYILNTWNQLLWMRPKNNTDSCMICFLKTESIALKAIEKIDFENKYWKDNYSQKGAFCGDKDLLIFLLQKNWNKCLDKYLAKVCDTNRHINCPINPLYPNSYSKVTYYDYYNCQQRNIDSKNDYDPISPYDFTTDTAAIKILNKYKFFILTCDSVRY